MFRVLEAAYAKVEEHLWSLVLNRAVIQKEGRLNREPSEISWNTKTPDLVRSQFIGLTIGRNFHQPGGYLHA